MTAAGTRQGLLTGLGLGLVAAALIFAGRGSVLPLVSETLLALGAGALAAYLAPQRGGGAALSSAGPQPGNPGLRAGVSAGVTLGLVSAVALTAAADQLIDSPAFRTEIAPQLAPLNTGADSLTGLIVGCSGCFYLLVVPAITAGLGALGAWLGGLARPASRAVPPAAPAAPGGPGGRIG